eukprot:1168238-Alexandrium_andersonii.AAC.1
MVGTSMRGQTGSAKCMRLLPGNGHSSKLVRSMLGSLHQQLVMHTFAEPPRLPFSLPRMLMSVVAGRRR